MRASWEGRALAIVSLTAKSAYNKAVTDNFLMNGDGGATGSHLARRVRVHAEIHFGKTLP